MITKSLFLTGLTACSLLLSSFNETHAAEFYPITSISSSTAVDDFYPVIQLIQGSGTGFDAVEPHAAIAPTSGSLWVTAAPGGTEDYYVATGNVPPVLVIDLGSDVELSEISTWGYSTGNSNGVKDFTLRFATEAEGAAGFGTSISYNPTFPCALDPLARDSHNFTETVTARYVEFIGFDNYGGEGLPGGDRVGLGEIAFAFAPDDPTISVPASVELSLTAAVVTTQISVGNVGNADLTISGTSFTGPNAAAFTATVVPASVAGISSEILEVQFDPAGLLGPVSATLQITSNDPNTPTAEILLTGTVPPAAQNIIVSDPPIDRSLSVVKASSIPIENDGGTPLVISSANFSGPDVAAFSIISFPATVDPTSIANVEIQIDPTGLVGQIEATLEIGSDDPETPVVQILIQAVALGEGVDFFPITSVQSSTAANDLWAASNLIQGPGTGYEAASPYTKLLDAADGNWVTADPGGFPSDYIEAGGKPVLTFDLGENSALGEISLWGYAATNSNGVSEFSLRFATESEGITNFGNSISYNPLFAGINSGEFRNADNFSRFSFPFSEAAVARYVELTCEDNFFISPGDGSGGGLAGGDRVGLGEVAFSIVGDLPGDDFRILSIDYDSNFPGANGNRAVTFVFKSRPNTNYSLWRSTDMQEDDPNEWEELSDTYPSTGEETSYTDTFLPLDATRMFYQVRPGLE